MKPILLMAAMLPLIVEGCLREMPLPDEQPLRLSGKASLKPISVHFSAEDMSGEDSKSVISVDAEEFKKAYLFAFDTQSKTIILDAADETPVAMKTSSRTFEWPLPAGLDDSGEPQPMDIYALVNPDASTEALLEDFLSRTDLEEDELEELVFLCSDASSLLNLEDSGMPMSGKRTEVCLDGESDELELTLKRLFARYDIRLNIADFATEGWTVGAAEVLAAQSNTRAPFFYSGEGAGVRAGGEDLTFVDFATESDILKMNDFGADKRSSEAVTLYFLENCQGDIGPASKWNRVFGELGAEVAHCSYVDILVEASHRIEGEKKFKYRLYPGQDAAMCGNFDIIRNRHQKVVLRLHPREASEDFEWVYDQPLRVAPGESLQIRFETSLSREELIFRFSLSGLPTSLLEVNTCTFYENANQSSAGHTTYMPHYGIVTVTTHSSVTDGQVYQLYGGNGADLGDTANITIDSSVSFWKDVRILHMPEYRGQWMIVQLPENVFGVGYNFQAGITHFSQNGEGNYVQRNTDWIDISRTWDAFGPNGKTGILKPHVWYDHTANRLFVYAYTPNPETGHYNRLTLLITEEDPVTQSEFDLYRKNLDFEQKDLRFRLLERPDTEEISIETWITGEGAISSEQDMYFALVDTEKGNTIIDNCYFEWGGDGRGHSFTGLNGAPWKQSTPGFFRENFFIESQVEYDWPSAISSQFNINYEIWRDLDAYDFDFYNLDIMPKVKAAFPYSAGAYLSVSHSFFPGEVRLYPICQYLPAPRRRLVVLEAIPGTNDYTQMRCSQKEVAGETEFYLMYGFRQTFFVRTENLTGTPSVSLDRASGQPPYLQYALTEVKAGLYRLDLWVDRYENPLDYDEAAVPYSDTDNMDSNAGDKQVRITLSASYGGTTYTQNLVCTVLHKRFRMEFETAGNAFQVQMWNPLGFVLSGSAYATVNYERYWKRHPIKQILDGPYKEMQSAVIPISSDNLLGQVFGGNLSSDIERASVNLRGIRCDYAIYVHPVFQEKYGSDSIIEDLILFYPNAEAQSLSLAFSLDDGPFVSTIPGLSLKGITFLAENFISFPGRPISIQYRHSTLSEYYLQGIGFQSYDIKYYGYIFQCPVLWTEYNPWFVSPFTSNAPEHLGGPDSMKSVPGRVLYGTGVHEAGNPVVYYG